MCFTFDHFLNSSFDFEQKFAEPVNQTRLDAVLSKVKATFGDRTTFSDVEINAFVRVKMRWRYDNDKRNFCAGGDSYVILCIQVFKLIIMYSSDRVTELITCTTGIKKKELWADNFFCANLCRLSALSPFFRF